MKQLQVRFGLVLLFVTLLTSCVAPPPEVEVELQAQTPEIQEPTILEKSGIAGEHEHKAPRVQEASPESESKTDAQNSATIEPEETPVIASPGAPGVGDSLYPLLGNGGYDVDHYTVDIDADPASNHISGIVTLEAVATQNLSAFNLDLVGLELTDVTIDDRPAAFTREGQELTITPAQVLLAGDRFKTNIVYAGTPETIQDASAPIVLGWQPQTGGSFVVSEPSGAMNWFPHNNHPSDKAAYTFKITVPEPYEVVSNGVLVERVPKDGYTTYVWAMDQPMASYLATVHIGAYDVETGSTPGAVPIRNYFPSSLSTEVRPGFDDTPDMIEFMERLIAPYPFDEYGVVLLTEPAGWALETQTLSTFGALGANRPETVMHEVSHSWFGNDVSPATWQDIWLNEGFAQYFSLLWLDHSGVQPLDQAMAGVYAMISSQGAGPPALPEKEDLFGLSSYFRGAYSLHALRKTVGDDLFFDILRTYYQRFRKGSASTADFLAVACELGGNEAEHVLSDWLYGETVPHPIE